MLGEQLSKLATSRDHKVAIAESCTGGLVSSYITQLAGASRWFLCGFIVYSDQSKISMLGVSPNTLKEFGAVSSQIAIEMCSGVLLNSHATVAASITGIAGPAGATINKPLGTVYLGCQRKKYKASVQHLEFNGTREDIRLQTVIQTLQTLIQVI